jgi:integrase
MLSKAVAAQVERRTDEKSATLSKTAFRKLLVVLGPNQNQSIYLRDGEVVLYQRSRSLLYQCRFKLADGTWTRQSTGKAALEHAIARACEIYDEARFRQRLGLAHRTHSVAQIAAICCADLRQQIDAKGKKSALNDYLSIIERYFVPYFGERQLESLTHGDMREFELWRDRQMTRRPKTSTLNNFTSAWSRVVAAAVERGYISERVPVPKLTSRGEKGRTRAAFSGEEMVQLLAYMDAWQTQGRMAVEREIRPLLRDYIEMLLYTGMRHGTEAMGICWRDLEWHTKDGVRYLRIWVDGKTGGRWLIAKHSAVDVLRRLHARQRDIAAVPFEDMLTARVPHLLFRFSDGHQPHSMVGTFRRLMRDSGLLLNSEGQARTLYSLRHTYATLALLEGGTDIHTLSKQMGNSAAMIERHYSKLTATMAADRLA